MKTIERTRTEEEQNEIDRFCQKILRGANWYKREYVIDRYNNITVLCSYYEGQNYRILMINGLFVDYVRM